MAKYKKTRQQKIISDLRKKLQTVSEETVETNNQSNQGFSYQYSANKRTNQQPTKSASIKNDYSYLSHDIFRIGILTGTIILAQLILFFLLKNHIVILPMVKY